MAADSVRERAAASLEEVFTDLLTEVIGSGERRLRIFVQGTPRPLNPAMQKQLFLISREAVMNALRHSAATTIEVEVQYLHELRLLVRDNGCGIDGAALQRESHCGLSAMRERAETIGARFGIWSRTGAGTEVRIALPVDAAKAQPSAAFLERGGASNDERQWHPSLEHRRSPFGPGGYRRHYQQPARHVAAGNCF